MKRAFEPAHAFRRGSSQEPQSIVRESLSEENRSTEPPVFLVDDEPQSLSSYRLALTVEGYTDIRPCASGKEALAAMAGVVQGVAVLDITMPDMDGITLLRRIGEEHPGIVCVMVTGLNDTATVVECIRAGAYDYTVKPVDRVRLATTVRMAAEHLRGRAEAERVRDAFFAGELRDPTAFDALVTADARMLALFRYLEALAPTELPVLVTGETGVGKELFAQAIHKASGRSGAFVAFNSAGIDDALFSDALFGHKRGAFTSAVAGAPGLIDRAAGGTLFLDEVGDLRPETQVKLLRLLQERTFYRLGATQEEQSRARVIAATNRSLGELATAGHFRKDLFYRLKSHHVCVPPLRDRRGDLPALVAHFTAQAAASCGKGRLAVPREVLAVLADYSFPGNVRELAGMVADAVARSTGSTLSSEPFKAAVGLGAVDAHALAEEGGANALALQFPSPLPTAEAVCVALLTEALRRSGGNKSLAAEMTGLARQTFRAKCTRYGIT